MQIIKYTNMVLNHYDRVTETGEHRHAKVVE